MNKFPTNAKTPALFTRRRLLKAAAGAAIATALPANVRRAVAQSPRQGGSLRDIKHVVLLMQENRSFDHYFGTMAGVRGFGDPDAMTLSTGRSVFHQPDPQNPLGYLLPFHLDTRKTSAQKIPSTNHSWKTQHASWNHGRMDNWMPAHRLADGLHAGYVMGYHTREDIPFQFALAEAFTICDAYHCSLFGPTWPNRMYWMTGTIDPEGSAGGPIISDVVPPDGLGWTTYAERLQQAGVTWKVYQEEDNYQLNMLQFFRSFLDAPPDSPLRRNGTDYGPADQFEYDAINDRLPTVSWLIPKSIESEHPNYMPALGANYIARKLDAIAANPEVWAKTVFIVVYDENDGLFDHVPPPVPPPHTPHEFIGGVPIGAGFRVPCIIVSPWTAGGWVCSQPFDHTSCLRFVERLTGVVEPQISDWRRRTFGDFTSVFRFDDAATPPPNLPDTDALLDRARYESAHLSPPVLPASEQSPPVQQPGQRKRVPRGST